MRAIVAKIPTDGLSFTNCVILHPSDCKELDRYHEHSREKMKIVVRTEDCPTKYVFAVLPSEDMKKGYIGFNCSQIKWIQGSRLDYPVLVTLYVDGQQPAISLIILNVNFLQKTEMTEDQYDTDKMLLEFREMFIAQPFTVHQNFVFKFKNKPLMILCVQRIDVLYPDLLSESSVPLVKSSNIGIFHGNSQIIFEKAEESLVNLGGKAAMSAIINQQDWDFSALRIYGLDKEFSAIFRRAFASRIFARDYFEEQEVKDIRYFIKDLKQFLKVLDCPRLNDGDEPTVESFNEQCDVMLQYVSNPKGLTRFSKIICELEKVKEEITIFYTKEQLSQMDPDMSCPCGFDSEGHPKAYQDSSCIYKGLVCELGKIEREFDLLNRKDGDEVWRVKRETPFWWKVPEFGSTMNSIERLSEEEMPVGSFNRPRGYDGRACTDSATKVLLSKLKSSRKVTSMSHQVDIEAASSIDCQPRICVRENYCPDVKKKYRQFNSSWKNVGDLVLYMLPFLAFNTFVKYGNGHSRYIIDMNNKYCDKLIMVLSSKMKKVIGVHFANSSSLEHIRKSRKICLFYTIMFHNACKMISPSFKTFKIVPIVVCQTQDSAEMAGSLESPETLFISPREFELWQVYLKYDSGSKELSEIDSVAFKKVVATVRCFLKTCSQKENEKFSWQS